MWCDNYYNNFSCWSTTTIRRNPLIIFGSSATITSEILLAALSRFSEKGRWLNHMLSSGTSESKTSNSCAEHTEDDNVGAGDWLAQNIELGWRLDIGALPGFSDQHQPQPEYGVGCDSERENLCPQDSERVNKTTPGASSSERLEHQVPGDWLPQKICQVERKFIFIQRTDGEKYVKKFDDLANNFNLPSEEEHEFYIQTLNSFCAKCWSRSYQSSELFAQRCDLEPICDRLMMGFILNYKGSRRLQNDGDE